MIWLPEIPFPFSRLFKRQSVPAPQPERAPEPVEIQIEIPVKHLLQVADDFTINPLDWLGSGDRDAIFASSGMGKSYLAGVLVEEILETGGLVVIIDPEGENYTLAEKYNLLIVGGDHATVGLNLDTASREAIDEVLKTVLTNGISIIFDLSERTQKNQQELFTMIGSSLFTLQDKPELRRPVKFVVEEARVFAPQKAGSLPKVEGETCLEVFQNIATRGRKRGINMMFATQRPAAISKDILSEANRFWFGGVTSDTDCKALKSYLDEAGVTAEDLKAIPRASGEFYFYANGDTKKIKTRKRKCKHGGATPAPNPEHLKIASRSDVAAAVKQLNRIGSADI
jgi:hypothetical protein